MIPHRDEILRPAVSTDATAVPRFDLVRPDGTIIEKNVAMRLANPVAREGTPISKAVLDEMLAASGVTAGTATAYTLAQEEYTLFDGAPVRFRLHVSSGDGATLNINGTGAKPLRDMMGEPMAGGVPAGTWLAAYYSAAAGAYVLAGGEAVRALYGERYTVDDAVAYVKDVPADALPVAEIGEIGGMTYKVNVGTEANPVYELRSAPVTEVESVGANLIPYPYKDTTKTTNGVTFTDNGDGTITVDGTATENAIFYIKLSNEYLELSKLLGVPSGQYTFSGMASVDGFYMDILSKVGSNIEANQSFNTEDKTDQVFFAIRIVVLKGTTVSNVTTYPMLNRGTTARPYTPYFHDVLPIPEAVRALDGYGWGYSATVRNYIDWKNRKFVKMFGRVDLGTLNCTYNQSVTRFEVVMPSDYKRPAADNERDSCLVAIYKYDQSPINGALPYVDMTISGYNNDGNVYINNSAYANAASFQTAMSGVMLYYELAEPIITDISDLLPADNIIGVQPRGTITAVNEYNYAVPTTITYQRNVLANRASIFAIEKLRLAMELLAKADLSNASGTFGGVVKANAAAVSALGTAQVRNVTISATDLTAGSSALATGDSYHVYS